MLKNRLTIAGLIVALIAIVTLPAVFASPAAAMSCRYTYGFNLQGQYVVTGYDCN